MPKATHTHTHTHTKLSSDWPVGIWLAREGETTKKGESDRQNLLQTARKTET